MCLNKNNYNKFVKIKYEKAKMLHVFFSKLLLTLNYRKAREQLGLVGNGIASLRQVKLGFARNDIVWYSFIKDLELLQTLNF